MVKPKRLTVTCQDVMRHVEDELDTKLSYPQFRGFKSHLDRCPNCRAYLDSLRKTIWLYRHYPIPHQPVGSRRRVLRAVFAHNRQYIGKGE
jgi:predicted anti-sigma-YlaC factor YlaD